MQHPLSGLGHCGFFSCVAYYPIQITCADFTASVFDTVQKLNRCKKKKPPFLQAGSRVQYLKGQGGF